MPRKNNTPRHTPKHFINREAGKKRFATEREATQAAEYQMLLKPDLELFVYKSDIDQGWYLTRKTPGNKR